MDFTAVMVVGHFVVSVFNVPLGNPMWQFVPFPNMELCQQYVQYQQTPPNGYQLSIEHKMYKTAQCVTREEFEAQMQMQQQQQGGAAPQQEDQPKPLAPGWEVK